MLIELALLSDKLRFMEIMFLLNLLLTGVPGGGGYYGENVLNII